jgi:hypothetical protein
MADLIRDKLNLWLLTFMDLSPRAAMLHSRSSFEEMFDNRRRLSPFGFSTIITEQFSPQ